MRLPDSPSDELGDDLIFDPVLERKRIADGTEEYLEELRRDWEKYAFGKNSFPEKISKISSALREWMLSFDRTNFYDRLAREFGLQGADRVGIARIAWDIVLKSDWSPSAELFQKHISQASVVPEISKRFAVDFIPKARELSLIADARQNASLSSISRSVPTEQKAIDRVEISLMQALGKFEKLGGQQVTNSKIVVKGQNDPVRPTIFNWLRAYRDELGVGAHDAVARGQFLFHSLNGKGLTAGERDQVGMLLKSLDENMSLTIDAGRQEVVFQRTTVVPPAGGASAVRGAVLEPNTFQIAVAPLQKRNDRSQIQNSGLRQPTDLEAERPLFANQDGNISRAVFDLPHVSQQITENREQGREADTNSGRTAPKAERPMFASREQDTFQTAVAPLKPAERPSFVPLPERMAVTPPAGGVSAVRDQVTPAPAPRTISFEPAKIDTFSFGSGDQKTFSNSGRTPQAGERPLPTRTEDFRPNFAPRDDMNVSALSFSTNHVMPAEKEAVNRKQKTRSREHDTSDDSNSGRIAQERLPASGGERPSFESKQQEAIGTTVTPPAGGVSAVRGQNTFQMAAASFKSGTIAPSAPPVNRYRITPTGHRDEVASDDTPSPHVVDLRG